MHDPTANIEVIGNFEVVQQIAAISFPAVGTCVNNMTGSRISVPSVPFTITLKQGEYHLYSNTALKLKK